MTKAIIPASYNDPATGEPLEIELRQPWLAALLAWLVPGLGHIYQGRTAKGLLFFICIMGTFAFGLWGLGGGKVVYASNPTFRPGDQPWRWQYLCQLGVGLPAVPAYLQRTRAEGPPHPVFGEFMAPPSKQIQQDVRDDSNNMSTQPNELARWTVEMHPFFELGTIYTVIAGLLNLLVICDAYGGPLIVQPRPKKSSGKESGAPEGVAAA
jgi:hypothetical protein